jgi:hypothetical protein
MSYTIKRTFHTGFCVGDLDWTIGFFQQVLGFKLIDKRRVIQGTSRSSPAFRGLR